MYSRNIENRDQPIQTINHTFEQFRTQNNLTKIQVSIIRRAQLRIRQRQQFQQYYN